MILGKNFSNLKVILVEPNGPLNVGSVARLCSNFEVDELRIVSPKCDIFCLEAKKMALKGHKFLENCKIFDDLQKAIFDCDLVLASCGRIDVNKNSFFESSEDMFNWTMSFKKINNLGIIFGREDRGLTNEELQRCNLHLHIPANIDYPVLNLSMAVQVVCYQLYVDAIINRKQNKSEYWDVPTAESNHVKRLINHFIEVSEQLEVFNKGNPRQIGARIKRMFTRIGLDEMEVNFMRGFLAAVEKKLKDK